MPHHNHVHDVYSSILQRIPTIVVATSCYLSVTTSSPKRVLAILQYAPLTLKTCPLRVSTRMLNLTHPYKTPEPQSSTYCTVHVTKTAYMLPNSECGINAEGRFTKS